MIVQPLFLPRKAVAPHQFNLCIYLKGGPHEKLDTSFETVQKRVGPKFLVRLPELFSGYKAKFSNKGPFYDGFHNLC